MDRLTKFVTPVGMCMTNLNSMKHYMPCVPCRHKSEKKIDANGKMYTEKHSYCDTCEVKMLFNKLKHYEDLEEQGRLIELPCLPNEWVWIANENYIAPQKFLYTSISNIISDLEDGIFIARTYEEAEAKLEGGNNEDSIR